MNYKIITFSLRVLLYIVLPTFAALSQEMLQQTVKGTITDQDSNSPIIGATVVILNSDPVLGSSTGIEGDFRIENVPIGRITIVITSSGYEQRVIPDIVVGSGKEVVIQATLQESLV